MTALAIVLTVATASGCLRLAFPARPGRHHLVRERWWRRAVLAVRSAW